VPRLPALSWRDVDRVLQRLGFVAVRQKGSHVFYRHPDGRTTTVPHHAGRDIAPSLLRKVLDDIRMTPDEFLTALRS
jgi:predicted RNA binding protein YcfA (HicA-like mRNA interferase family)